MIDPDLLRPWLDSPAHAAVLADYDGTLASIVSDPEGARLLPGALPTLRRLADRFGRVAVVSGRPVHFLLEHVGDLPGVTLYGLYGLEQAEGGRVSIRPEAEEWRPAVETVANAAERLAPTGVYVERKGLSVGVHYRAAPQHRDWVEEFATEQAGSTGLEAHRGRMSVELRPPVRIDKGTVVIESAPGMEATCFLGDDRGDLPAFAALARLRADGMATLAVAVRSAEIPTELLEAADLVVDGPEGALQLLQTLASG